MGSAGGCFRLITSGKLYLRPGCIRARRRDHYRPPQTQRGPAGQSRALSFVRGLLFTAARTAMHNTTGAVPSGPEGRRGRSRVKARSLNLAEWVSIMLSAVLALMAVLTYLRG